MWGAVSPSSLSYHILNCQTIKWHTERNFLLKYWMASAPQSVLCALHAPQCTNCPIYTPDTYGFQYIRLVDILWYDSPFEFANITNPKIPQVKTNPVCPSWTCSMLSLILGTLLWFNVGPSIYVRLHPKKISNGANSFFNRVTAL